MHLGTEMFRGTVIFVPGFFEILASRRASAGTSSVVVASVTATGLHPMPNPRKRESNPTHENVTSNDTTSTTQ